MHTHTHTHKMHIYLYTKHTREHYIHTNTTHKYTHRHMHAYTYTCMQTLSHTHTHTHTHTRLPTKDPPCVPEHGTSQKQLVGPQSNGATNTPIRHESLHISVCMPGGREITPLVHTTSSLCAQVYSFIIHQFIM